MMVYNYLHVLACMPHMCSAYAPGDIKGMSYSAITFGIKANFVDSMKH
jgi:hypothetical protein